MKKLLLLLCLCGGIFAYQPRELVEVLQPASSQISLFEYRPLANKNFFFAYGELLIWQPTQNKVDYSV